jgi:hypothetical protein
MTTTTNLTTKWFTVDNKEGVDFNFPQPISVTTAPEIPTARIGLGEIVHGNNGSRWLFVQASSTVTANNLVAIDVNFAANNLTSVLAASLKYTIGIAEFQATVANTGDYFWACLEARGGAAVNVINGQALSGTQLYVSSTQAGAVTTSVSAAAVHGLYINSTIVGATTTVDVVTVEPITTSA